MGVGVAGVWELGGPAGVANCGCGDVEAVRGVATLGPEGGRSLTVVSDSLLMIMRKCVLIMDMRSSIILA